MPLCSAPCSKPTGAWQRAQRVQRVQASRKRGQQAVPTQTQPEQPPPGPAPLPTGATRGAARVEEKDMWEDDQFELLGSIASVAMPVLAAAGVLIGVFASSTYDEGATVFLDVPKSGADTAKLIPAAQKE